MSRPIQTPVVLTSSSRRRLRLRGLRGARSSSQPYLPPLDETQPDGEIDADDRIFGRSAQNKYSASSSACSRRSTSTNSTSSSLFSQDEDVTSSIRTADDLSVPKRPCLRIRTQEDSLALLYRSTASNRMEKDADASETEQERESLDPTIDAASRNQVTDHKNESSSFPMHPSAQIGAVSAVSFSQVTVHRHLITLGDNPSPTDGPPISIEWKAFDSHTLDLEEYEAAKPEPRMHHELLIPRILREGWLLSNGVPRRAIQAAEKEVQRVQQRRWADATAYFVETNPQAAAYFKQANSSSRAANFFKQGARKLFPGWH